MRRSVYENVGHVCNALHGSVGSYFLQQMPHTERGRICKLLTLSRGCRLHLHCGELDGTLCSSHNGCGLWRQGREGFFALCSAS